MQTIIGILHLKRFFNPLISHFIVDLGYESSYPYHRVLPGLVPGKEVKPMRLIMIIILLVNAACVSADRAGGSSGSSPYNFTINYPDEWKRLNTERFLIIAKDSRPFPQYILAQQRPIDKPFGHTAQLLKREMPPLDAAEIIVEEIQSDDSLLDFKVAEIVPALVGGYNGFRMVFTYKTKKSYKFKSIYYGFLRGEWFYTLRFIASEKYLLDKDIETFHRVLNSFKILKTKTF